MRFYQFNIENRQLIVDLHRKTAPYSYIAMDSLTKYQFMINFFPLDKIKHIFGSYKSWQGTMEELSERFPTLLHLPLHYSIFNDMAYTLTNFNKCTLKNLIGLSNLEPKNIISLCELILMLYIYMKYKSCPINQISLDTLIIEKHKLVVDCTVLETFQKKKSLFYSMVDTIWNIDNQNPFVSRILKILLEEGEDKIKIQKALDLYRHVDNYNKIIKDALEKMKNFSVSYEISADLQERNMTYLSILESYEYILFYLCIPRLQKAQNKHFITYGSMVGRIIFKPKTDKQIEARICQMVVDECLAVEGSIDENAWIKLGLKFHNICLKELIRTNAEDDMNLISSVYYSKNLLYKALKIQPE